MNVLASIPWTIKCVYTNIDGFNPLKGNELNLIMSQDDPDILFVVETKMYAEDIMSQYLMCNGYREYRKDRQGIGGGVLLMVKDTLETNELPLEVSNELEAVGCMVGTGKNKFPVLCVYRPPSASEQYNKQVCKLIENTCNIPSRQILICGDFNYGDINWTKGSARSKYARKFLHACQNSFLYQHVSEFTRVRGSDEPSLLDLILTRNNVDIEEIKYGPPIGKSDHCVLTFCACVDGGEDAVSTIETPRLNYHKGNYSMATHMFRNINWNEVLTGNDVESMWMTFLSYYTSIVEQCVPTYRTDRSRKLKKWMNMSVLRLVRQKEEAWKKYRKNTNSKRLYRKYQHVRNNVTTAVRNAKFEFEHRLAREVKRNPKAFFSYARSKTAVKEDVLFVKKTDGQLTGSLKETCEVLNEEFQRVFCRMPQLNPLRVPVGQGVPDGNEMPDIVITKDKVKSLIKTLKAQTSPGPDGVHPRVLLECADALTEPIFKIFDTSMRTGCIPSDWKKGNITPVYKKGSKVNALNYRPISLTPVLCKLLEKIIVSCIMDHLESQNLLSPHQHGFRSNKSCLTQLLEYLHFVEEEVDNGQCVDVIYLDCSKAFDTVPHQLLLAKLQSLGICGRTLNWIRDFLTGRLQRVQVKGTHSEWREVWSGVPQGSVLGPTLFLVYVNDLLDGLHSYGKLFADDAKIYRRVMTPQDRCLLQDDLDRHRLE